MKIAHFLAIVSVLAACGSGQSSYSEVRLPSGKVIKSLGTGRIFFSAGDPALMLKYETDCSLDDKAALQREIDEIWAAFRADVERANLKNAIISANEPPKGFIVTTNRSFNFVFKRSADGTWSQSDTAANKALQPTRAAEPNGQREPADSGPRG